MGYEICLYMSYENGWVGAWSVGLHGLALRFFAAFLVLREKDTRTGMVVFAFANSRVCIHILDIFEMGKI